MVRLGLLRRSPKKTEDQPQIDEQPAGPARTGPDLVLLVPEAPGASSFRLHRFTDADSAAAFASSLHRAAKQGLHAFWALPVRPVDTQAGNGDEALVLVRAHSNSDLVSVVSFVDIESAHSFARFEVKRGLDPSLVMIYWGVLVAIVENENGIQLTPTEPPEITPEAWGAAIALFTTPTAQLIEEQRRQQAAEKRRIEAEFAEIQRRQKEAEDLRKRQAEAVEKRRQEAQDERKRRRNEAEQQRRLQAEAEELRRLKVEAELLKKQQAEAEKRARREAEERARQAEEEEGELREAEAEEQRKFEIEQERLRAEEKRWTEAQEAERKRLRAEFEDLMRLQAEAEAQERQAAAERRRRAKAEAEAEEQRKFQTEARELARLTAKAEALRRQLASAEERARREAEERQAETAGRTRRQAEKQELKAHLGEMTRQQAEIEERRRFEAVEAERQRLKAELEEVKRQQAEAEDRQRRAAETEERRRIEAGEAETQWLKAQLEEMKRQQAEEKESERHTDAEEKRWIEAEPQEMQQRQPEANAEEKARLQAGLENEEPTDLQDGGPEYEAPIATEGPGYLRLAPMEEPEPDHEATLYEHELVDKEPADLQDLPYGAPADAGLKPDETGSFEAVTAAEPDEQAAEPPAEESGATAIRVTFVPRSSDEQCPAPDEEADGAALDEAASADVAAEVEKILRVRRWEKRDKPFRGFDSPPGRF